MPGYVNQLLVDPNNGLSADGYSQVANQLSQWGRNTSQTMLNALSQPLIDRQTGALSPLADQYAGLVGGFAGTALNQVPRSGMLSQLIDHYGAGRELPVNEGGQQVIWVVPDGRIVAANHPSHTQMLKSAGIDASAEQFMQDTGTVRAHGPDNFEMWAQPTPAQVGTIRKLARDSGSSMVNVDAMPPAGGNYVSDFIDPRTLGAFSEGVYGSK